MPHFVRSAVPVEAHRFDGSVDSARTIAAAFPYRVGRPVDREGELLVLCGARLVRVLPETWIAENEATRVLQTWPDDQFEILHRPSGGA